MITPMHASVSRSSRRASVLVILLSLLLVRAAPLAAQTYTLAPSGYQTVLSNTGTIVANACVWTYSAGTTTPAATYRDTLGTVNTNPIRTDPAGRFTAYLLPGVGYSFVYELPCTPPAHGVVLRTADPVRGPSAAPEVLSGSWTPNLGGTTTYTAREGTWVRIGPLVVARGTLTVNVLGTGSPTFVDGLPFPAAADTPGVLGSVSPPAAAAFVNGSVFVGAGSSIFGVQGMAAIGPESFYLAFFANGTHAAFVLTYLTNVP